MLALVGAIILGIARIATVREPARRRDASVLAELRVGFDGVVSSPLMRLVALAYVLLAILMASVTYPFMRELEVTFTTEASRATALGQFYAAVTGMSLVVSILLANRVYARFGVAGAALLLPLVYVGGFGLWLVAFGFPTAALFRFTQQVTQRGISNAAWSAFYNVIPAGRRAQVLAFNDGVPNQVGAIIAGLLLLAGGRWLEVDQMFVLGIVVALVATAVGIGIRRRYAGSLVDALRAGFGEQVLEGGPGLALPSPSIPPVRRPSRSPSPRPNPWSARPLPPSSGGRRPSEPGASSSESWTTTRRRRYGSPPWRPSPDSAAHPGRRRRRWRAWAIPTTACERPRCGRSAPSRRAISTPSRTSRSSTN